MDGLRLSSQRREDITIITMNGDLDIVTSRLLDDFLNRASREHSRVVLDLSGVEFMDTSALALIVGHWKKLVARGGLLALAGARYRYTKTLWITGLAGRLPLYPDVETAILASKGGATAGPDGHGGGGAGEAAPRPTGPAAAPRGGPARPRRRAADG